MTSIKNLAISKEISQDLLKAKAKQLGGNQNDVLMTILSVSIRQYLTKYTSDRTTDVIQLAMPFGLRQKPSHTMDFMYCNHFAVLPFSMRLVDNFSEGYKAISNELSKMNRSMTPFAMVHMHSLIMRFPMLFREWILNDFSKRFTFAYSYINGPVNPTSIARCRSRSLSFVEVAHGTMSGSISIFSHCQKIKICLSIDKAVMRHPSDLMEIIYSNL